MEYFGITDRGKIRKDNQDCFLAQEHEAQKCLIAVLCDGMGGAKAGGLASDVASKAFVACAEERLTDSPVRRPSYANIITGACSEANGVVYQYSCFDSNYSGMGTTLVGGIILKDKAFIVNVGDSRAYHISKKRIVQITRDQSLVEEMVQRGEITREEARNHPRRNIITNALGLESSIKSDIFEVKLQKGDRIFMCSDGVSNLIDDEQILEESRENPDTEKFCRSLIELALDLNSPDNVTAFAVQI
jgi:Serine/threonine protein phosphatase